MMIYICVSEGKPDALGIALSWNLSLRVSRGVVVRHADLLTEQILAARQQPHVRAALMQLQPALLDSAPDAGAELCAASLERVEEGIVDLFAMDSAVLHRLDARSQLNELAGGDFRIGEGAFGDEFGIKTSSAFLA
ncbi:hypothetical protein ACVWXO_005671 [Bradyrhizobium sp. LM2.7]